MDKNQSQFQINRASKLKTLYSDDQSTRRRHDQTTKYAVGDYQTAQKVREALVNGIGSVDTIVKTSKQLYAVNPVYAEVIDYLANMYLWRYKVTPHKVYTKSKAKLKKKLKKDEYNLIYNLMLEVVDGLSIETVFPEILTRLFITGSVFFTTLSDENSLTVSTFVLDEQYCRKIAETQYGTSIIQFDFSYFDSLGLDDKAIKEYLKSFPKEFSKGYSKYAGDNKNR